MFQVLCFNFWIQRENEWCFIRSLYVRRIFCQLLCTCKSNTAGLSQEIITAISSPARSLTAAPIGWNYFRKELAAAPRGALKLSQCLAGTRGRQPVSVCKHSPSPSVSSLFDTCHLSALIQIQWHARLPRLQLCLHSHPDGPELPDRLLLRLRAEVIIKQGNKGDKEVCVSTGFGSKQLSGGVEIWGSASKTTERVWTESPKRDKAQRYRRWRGVSTPLCGSGGLTGYECQVGFVLKRKAIDEGKNRSLWSSEDKV